LWNRETERLGGLQIDDQLVLRRRLHREIAPLLSLENAIDIARRTLIQIDSVGAIGHQATSSAK
jgi:hypothetical protein